ncbi:MAG: hypothetical protein ACOVMQ_10905 [Cyclobacteriaceae bacterium]
MAKLRKATALFATSPPPPAPDRLSGCGLYATIACPRTAPRVSELKAYHSLISLPLSLNNNSWSHPKSN